MEKELTTTTTNHGGDYVFNINNDSDNAEKDEQLAIEAKNVHYALEASEDAYSTPPWQQ